VRFGKSRRQRDGVLRSRHGFFGLMFAIL